MGIPTIAVTIEASEIAPTNPISPSLIALAMQYVTIPTSQDAPTVAHITTNIVSIGFIP